MESKTQQSVKGIEGPDGVDNIADALRTSLLWLNCRANVTGVLLVLFRKCLKPIDFLLAAKHRCEGSMIDPNIFSFLVLLIT